MGMGIYKHNVSVNIVNYKYISYFIQKRSAKFEHSGLLFYQLYVMYILIYQYANSKQFISFHCQRIFIYIFLK